jgi:multidrug efflux pump
MKFTDIFVTRPVLATVVSLAILVVGLRALASLPVQQYPQTETGVISVTTTYYGADPDVVAGFITTPLENAIAEANGIDYITSVSRSSVSTITVNLRLNYDSNRALTEISAKVNAVRNSLPPQSQQPVVTIGSGMNSAAAMYLGFSSSVLPANNITDYILRVVQPKLQSIEGVQKAEILGGQNFALRAWLDPDRLASVGLTAADVHNRLLQNDYISGIGNTKGQMVQTTLTASTSLHTVEEFENLSIKEDGDAIVRLKDVAKVTLGAEDYESDFNFNGQKTVAIAINLAPGANLLTVADAVHAMFPEIQAQLPNGLTGNVAYDSSKFVDAAIDEVIFTLVEALLIVTLVVFAFMGSPRAVIIPTVAMPLSLIGTFGVMLALGFSINLLTLLALVLGIGLVVDDAIIVVENVTRHIEEGMKPFDASLVAARELGGPIVAMTVVLVAVYVPVAFQAGLTGTLFREFALTLVGAVTISAVVALTLSPMMCARMLREHGVAASPWETKFIAMIEHRFEQVHRVYMRILQESLRSVSVTLTFALIILGSIYFLYGGSQKTLAPAEDEGFLLAFGTPSTNATLEQRLIYAQQMRDLAGKYPEIDAKFQMEFPGQTMMGMILKPWDEREASVEDLQPKLQQDFATVPSSQLVVFAPQTLPGSFGLPVQFSIGTTQSYSQLNDVSQTFLQEALKSGMFMFLNADLRINRPQSNIDIDRDKAAQLGLTMNDIGNAMASMLGGGYTNYFSIEGRSYKVIPQVQQSSRLNTDQLLNYHIRVPDGSTIPLSTIASISTKAVPEALNHFQQLSASTISGVQMPGVSLGTAIGYLQDLAARTLPQGYFIDYGGPTRQFIQESSGFAVTFGFALIVIYLSLAALFESFRDPVIILVSVPMSIAGALIFINLGIGGATLNIYSQVGLVTLMGLISKHGILLVEFANEQQRAGKSKLEAIEAAASIRLRPILMTTAAMVFGVLPLVFASGAGAGARFAIGLVIATGISIGTLFTIFVVPAVYLVLATDHAKEGNVAALGTESAATPH